MNPGERYYLTQQCSISGEKTKITQCVRLCRIKGCYKKTKHAKFSEKQFLSLDTHTRVYVPGDKKCSFFRKFDVLCFSCNACIEIRPFIFLLAFPPLLIFATT